MTEKKRFEVAETIRRETSDFQTSDFRRALRACGGQPLQSYTAASFDKTIQPRPWREGKHANQAAPDGNAPLLPTAPPPKGETTHYDLRVAIAPSNHVRCAPRRGRFALHSTFAPHNKLIA